MVCELIQSFMAYADHYCLDGRLLRQANPETPAPYANLRVDACSAESCVEVERSVTFSPAQVRTAQALVHQSDLFINGASGNTGNIGISRSLTLSPFAREATLARLDAYENNTRLPSACNSNNNCEALSTQQIAALRSALGSNSTSLSSQIVGTVSAALGAAYGIHLFHALHTSATGLPFLSGLGAVLANDAKGAARLAMPVISCIGAKIVERATALAGASTGLQLGLAIAAGIGGLGIAIHYSGLGHYLGTDCLGARIGDWFDGAR